MGIFRRSPRFFLKFNNFFLFALIFLALPLVEAAKKDVVHYVGLNPAYLLDHYEPQLTNLDSKEFVRLVDGYEAENLPLPTDSEVLKSLRRATQALLMGDAGSVVFTGSPGSGKSYRLQLMMAYLAQQAPAELLERLYFNVDSSSFAARADGRAGSIEEKVRLLTNLSLSIPITLIIDELHGLDGAGTHAQSTVDVFEMLKESLSTGRIRIIGATTDFEYESYIGARPALAQRFLRVGVEEATTGEVKEILFKRHRATMARDLSMEVVSAIQEVSAVFGGNFAEPRRSLKLLEYVMGLEKMNPTMPIKTRSQLVAIASEYYNMDLEVFLNPVKNEALIIEAEKTSNQKILGMSDKVSEVFKSVRFWMNKNDRDKPLSLLIYGGRGAGKTFFSSAIADSLKYKFHKIALPSISSVEDLYSQIATQLEMYPFTLFLIDEVEKADMRLQRAFLGVLDSPSFNQRKILSTGRFGPVVSVSSKNAIFIFTTNAGEEVATLGLSSDQAKDKILDTNLIDKYLLDRMRKAIAFSAPNLEGLKQLIVKKWENIVKSMKVDPELLPSQEQVTAEVLKAVQNIYARPDKAAIGFGSKAPVEVSTPWEKISIRTVEGVLDNIAEEALANSRRYSTDASPSKNTCLSLFSI